MVNKNSPLPLYYQIEEHIKTLILSEELKAGDTLPSERELAERFQTSRMTVRQAIGNLVNNNYLYREKGRGTFVSHRKFEQNLQSLTSFSEDMKSRGLKPGNKLLHFQISPVADDLKEPLALEEGELVYTVKRIRLADDEPLALETGYIPVKLIPNLSQEILQKSLYRYVEEQLNYTLGYAHQTVEAAIVSKDEYEQLKIKKHDPVLLIYRKTFLEDGTPFEYVHSTYRADKYKFKINLDRL
ncbi:GntR family transcriptional regulator [Longirhabdus pacifica]|uniref:GntR family transcriptional regulator n=1 Tax=Longirhabdus pacifica TaxID=2305227 RepID=UPI00100872B4|nr:GntR family transcriptional regulator [Longirhabdus pacifica]